MDTLTNESLDKQAETILEEYQRAISIHQGQAQLIGTGIADKLRELLVLILHRWGVGMRSGGVWVYPRVGDNTVTVPNEVVPISEAGYALGLVHYEVFNLLHTYTQPCGYLYPYLQPIPLPANTIYMWVTSRFEVEEVDDGDNWGTLTVDGTIPCTLTTMLHPLPIEGQHYHGPITVEYYQDVVDNGGNPLELVQYLPTYKAGPNGTWILDRDWDEGYHYPGMVDDCC